MFINSRTGVWLAAILSALAVAAPNAQAGACQGCCNVCDVDIDWLEAQLYQGCSGWHLCVQYDIEIENSFPGQFKLELTLSEKGWPLLGEHARPLEIALLLDQPEEINDDGEIEYEGCVTIPLPHSHVRHAKDVKVLAKVVARCSGSVVNFVSRSVQPKPGQYMCACEACKKNCGKCRDNCDDDMHETMGNAQPASAKATDKPCCAHTKATTAKGCSHESPPCKGAMKAQPASAKPDEKFVQCHCTASTGKCTCNCLKCQTDCPR